LMPSLWPASTVEMLFLFLLKHADFSFACVVVRSLERWPPPHPAPLTIVDNPATFKNPSVPKRNR
jgi:hypothetical protein